MEDLMLKSERLAMEAASLSGRDLEMPRIKRNFSQIIEAGNQLYNRTVGASANRDASEVRASVLLGARGYDYQKVSRNLDGLVSRALKHYGTLSNQAAQPILRETDIQGFLKNERENAIIQVSEEIKKISSEQGDKQYWHTVLLEWEKEKLELLNTISGTGLETNDMDLTADMTMPAGNYSINRHDISPYSNYNQPRMTHHNTTISTAPFVERSIHNIVDAKAPKSNMDYTEIVYAKCVMNYVDQVVASGSRTDLVKDFIRSILKEVTETNIGDLWDTVASIISCCDPIASGTDPVVLRQSLPFQIKFVMSARRLLERKYREYAEITVHGGLNKVDDDPKSCYTLMKNFLGLKSPSWLSNITVLNQSISDMGGQTDDGMIEGHPVWNFIWHCLRAGLIDAAIEVALKSRDPKISESFVEILRVYNENEDKRLPLKLENQLRLEYKRSVHRSTDVYKKAVYNVLASCDLTFVEGSDRVEDYLWLRLCQVRFDHSGGYDDLIPIQQSTPVKTSTPQALVASNKLTLPQLQSLMSDELGEAHFNAQDNPLSFFKILFLTGQFEQAIEFLLRFQRFKSHSVHIAVTLNEVGLLVKPDVHLSLPILSKAAAANSVSGAIKSLNFTNILLRYTRKFANQNTTEALYYYYLLRNCTTPTKENLFVTHVSELVRETRDYDNLLGYINDFGRIRGVIDRFHLDIDDIVSRVAEDCENSGQYEDAVKLYDSTSKYGKVLEILTKLLSEVLPVRRTEKSEREKLENLAMRIANRYCEPQVDAPREIAGTFYLLLDLMTFFNYYHANQYSEALDTIQKLKLLPFTQSEVEVKSREFNKYPEEIRRNISDILLATMNMLYSTYKDQPSIEIRQKAKALITFSGMIQYRMPSDAIARLIELEVLIN